MRLEYIFFPLFVEYCVLCYFLITVIYCWSGLLGNVLNVILIYPQYDIYNHTTHITVCFNDSILYSHLRIQTSLSACQWVTYNHVGYSYVILLLLDFTLLLRHKWHYYTIIYCELSLQIASMEPTICHILNVVVCKYAWSRMQ